MSETNRKEIALDSIHCENCGFQLEERIRNIEKVSNATVDFESKTLMIEIASDSDFSDIVGDIREAIQKTEHNYAITETIYETNTEHKVLILKGLDCANCAARIEKAVRNIKGVHNATVDFVTKKLVIEMEHKRDRRKILKEVSSLVVQIESQIEVIESEKLSEEDEDEHIGKAELIRLGAGTVLFAAALAFPFSPPVEIGIFLASYLLAGSGIVFSAAKNIVRGQVFDENFLMSIATIGAFAIHQYPEAVAVMLFYQTGRLLESLAVNHSRRSISALMDIRPDYANVKRGDEVLKVSPDQVKTGEFIIVKPGEKVPLDGMVVDGASTLDTSAITGESLPKEVESGSEILSGTINKNGLLTVEVTKTYGESTVSKILDMVSNANAKKAPTEKFITKFAGFYTPVVVFIALALALLPPILIPDATFTDWIYRALVFLVVSCPCALVISIPLGFIGGIGASSKNGILVKGSHYLEALNNVDTIVFDKTGTLTKGTFKVTKICSLGEMKNQDLLEVAAYAESYSSHPIAVSIVKEFGKIDYALVGVYDEISGYGIKANFKGRMVIAGNSKLMRKENIDFSETDEAGTTVYVAVDGKFEGYIVISDELKEDSIKTIHELKEMGVRKIVILTGDSRLVGEKIGQELGVDKTYSELLPGQKVEKLEMLEGERKSKGKLVFVGDGINDAPVLTRADVGIAMGGLGSDAAIEASDIVIMTDEPSKIVTAIKIAKRTKRIVWQNIFFALTIKGLILILGAGGLATMWEAVFADVGVTLIAVFNALRVLYSKK